VLINAYNCRMVDTGDARMDTLESFEEMRWRMRRALTFIASLNDVRNRHVKDIRLKGSWDTLNSRMVIRCLDVLLQSIHNLLSSKEQLVHSTASAYPELTVFLDPNNEGNVIEFDDDSDCESFNPSGSISAATNTAWRHNLRDLETRTGPLLATTWQKASANKVSHRTTSILEEILDVHGHPSTYHNTAVADHGDRRHKTTAIFPLTETVLLPDHPSGAPRGLLYEADQQQYHEDDEEELDSDEDKVEHHQHSRLRFKRHSKPAWMKRRRRHVSKREHHHYLKQQQEYQKLQKSETDSVGTRSVEAAHISSSPNRSRSPSHYMNRSHATRVSHESNSGIDFTLQQREESHTTEKHHKQAAHIALPTSSPNPSTSVDTANREQHQKWRNEHRPIRPSAAHTRESLLDALPHANFFSGGLNATAICDSEVGYGNINEMEQQLPSSNDQKLHENPHSIDIRFDIDSSHINARSNDMTVVEGGDGNKLAPEHKRLQRFELRRALSPTSQHRSSPPSDQLQQSANDNEAQIALFQDTPTSTVLAAIHPRLKVSVTNEKRPQQPTYSRIGGAAPATRMLSTQAVEAVTAAAALPLGSSDHEFFEQVRID
jgi:hypothetical protein